ncbi:AAA family ATPase [Pseudomonas sp. DTU_2021_1001937_2_SI_NGA_ILE_001]|uniref:AAA family ATPase n=1 Tax=Pseudomonas sp. DTU_2021_1001937_2_SI_NGA_ILE_001 TaxID=3077589 RepID=UPI0028FC18ED|nr:AAA family ATPase [Pseudomonas sp. DTU_2021_1001937_2_SI_NGA_ILE_001]WNW14069.1 AAA family ATPase [Pseudomonas sp. DTU_2021_1001937_2_SI_NGA_ILE_001]
MSTRALERIAVKGLHNHIDLELDFNPGLNVIYGKNGRGKTTLLHIIANILELDFVRFVYLKFEKITLDVAGGSRLEIYKYEKGYVYIELNGNAVGIRLDGHPVPAISESEMDMLREALGDRSVYLPAYRAVLEKVRPASYDQARDATFEAIKKSEISALSKVNRSKFWAGFDKRATLVARKTTQCRDWFGQFVPIIRYPSLTEVIEQISEEFTDAQMESSQSERRMLSTSFIDVFRSLVSRQNTPSDGEIGSFIERVKSALDIEEDEQGSFPDYFRSLIGELQNATEYTSSQESAAQKRVLKIYAELLERRKTEKLAAFEKIRNFESAVNMFLDHKRLKVARRGLESGRDYVFVETEAGSKYPVSTLSSGERQILTMLFSATRMSYLTTGVFLIDEPELSLHVDWQRIILSELNSQAPLRQIIACTHSPEVGADHYESVQLFTPAVASRNNGPTIPADEGFMEDFT